MIVVVVIEGDLHNSEPTASANISLSGLEAFGRGQQCFSKGYQVNTFASFGKVILTVVLYPPLLKFGKSAVFPFFRTFPRLWRF